MILNNSYKKAMDKIELSDDLKDKIINNISKPHENKIYKFNPVSIRRLAGFAACFVFCFLSYYAVTNYYIQPNTNIVSVDAPKPTPNNEGSSEKIATNEPVQEQPTLKVAPKKKEETTGTNPPAYKEPEVNDNQVDVVSPKQGVATKDNSPVTDNDLPTFSKGKVSTENNNDNVIQKSSVVEVSAMLGYEIQSPQDAPTGYEVSNISVVDNSIAEITYQGENDIITYRTAKSSEDLSQDDNACEFMEIVNINNIDVVLKGNEELYYNAVWSANAESFSITSDTGIEKAIMVDMVSSVDYTIQPDADN